MDITRKAFECLLGKEPERVYLAHQLPEGALLSQIQNSAIPPYTLKSIRPTQTDTTKPKRVRKPAAPKPATAKPTTDPPTFSVVPPPPKKRRQGKVVPTLPKIACVACGQTDVPLIMGGRYCRPCAGPDPPTYPGTPQNGGTFMHKFWAGPNSGQLTPQPIINPQAVVNPNPQPITNPPSQPADSQQAPVAPAAPKRKKSSAKIMPTSNPPSQLSSSSKKKRSK